MLLRGQPVMARVGECAVLGMVVVDLRRLRWVRRHYRIEVLGHVARDSLWHLLLLFLFHHCFDLYCSWWIQTYCPLHTCRHFLLLFPLRPRRQVLGNRATLLTVIAVTIHSQERPDVVRARQCPHPLNVLSEQTDDCLEHGPNRPGRVPLLRMVLGDGQADLGVGLEAPVLVHEHDVWGFEGVLVGQENLTVVDALVELGALWALDGEVPGVDVVGEGLGSQVGQLLLGQLLGLAHYPLLADVRRPHDYYATHTSLNHS